MAEAVKLRADLADFAADPLVVVHDAFLAERPAGRPARNCEAEVSFARDRHVLLVGPAELIDLAGADQVARGQDLVRGQPIGGAALVARTPFRWPPLRADRRFRLLGRLLVLAEDQ